jgi:hypothetical protein
MVIYLGYYLRTSYDKDAEGDLVEAAGSTILVTITQDIVTTAFSLINTSSRKGVLAPSEPMHGKNQCNDYVL